MMMVSHSADFNVCAFSKQLSYFGVIPCTNIVTIRQRPFFSQLETPRVNHDYDLHIQGSIIEHIHYVSHSTVLYCIQLTFSVTFF